MTERPFEDLMMKEIRGYVKKTITGGAASWLEKAEICRLTEKELVINCGSTFAATVVEVRLKDVIEDAVREIFCVTPEVRIVTAEEAAVLEAKTNTDNN